MEAGVGVNPLTMVTVEPTGNTALEPGHQYVNGPEALPALHSLELELEFQVPVPPAQYRVLNIVKENTADGFERFANAVAALAATRTVTWCGV
jgi:hypothetical protein